MYPLLDYLMVFKVNLIRKLNTLQNIFYVKDLIKIFLNIHSFDFLILNIYMPMQLWGHCMHSQHVEQ
jgi:hypothetical protein